MMKWILDLIMLICTGGVWYMLFESKRSNDRFLTRFKQMNEEYRKVTDEHVELITEELQAATSELIAARVMLAQLGRRP